MAIQFARTRDEDCFLWAFATVIASQVQQQQRIVSRTRIRPAPGLIGVSSALRYRVDLLRTRLVCRNLEVKQAVGRLWGQNADALQR